MRPRLAKFMEEPVERAGHDADPGLGVIAARTPTVERRQQHGLGAQHRRFVVHFERFAFYRATLLARPIWHLKEIAPFAASERLADRVAGQGQDRAGRLRFHNSFLNCSGVSGAGSAVSDSVTVILTVPSAVSSTVRMCKPTDRIDLSVRSNSEGLMRQQPVLMATSW